jgi:tartrate-resistant acid phosphatase type 5
MRATGKLTIITISMLSVAIGLLSCSHLPYVVPASSDRVVRFAVIGDFGEAGQAEEDVARLVKSWNPDFIVTTGDNNYPRGAPWTIDENIGQYYHEYIHPYKGTYGKGARYNRFFPSIGNHDGYFVRAMPLRQYMRLPGNERFYDFTSGSVHLFCINSDRWEPAGRTADSAQAEWLKEKLAGSQARWKIVYMHHPPYSSASHGCIPGMQWPYKEWGATAVLAGHDHVYERLIINGFPYFVNGLGGNPHKYRFKKIVPGSKIRYSQDNGAMLVEASNERITFRFVTRTGLLIDTYSLP